MRWRASDADSRAFLRNEIDRNAHDGGHEDPGEKSRQEQLTDGDAGDAAIDDKRLGGMTGPMVAAAPVIAAVNFLSKPRSGMAFMASMPNPAASATAAPHIPDMMTAATMTTCARPPQVCPTRLEASGKCGLSRPHVHQVAGHDEERNGQQRESGG